MRLLLAEAASRCTEGQSQDDTIMSLIVDIKRANFYADAQQDIYVRLPDEDPKSADSSICGKLAKSLYGTRDAGSN